MRCPYCGEEGRMVERIGSWWYCNVCGRVWHA